MRQKTFPSPAKINLCLHVLGRRLDGYHELAMAMQRVALYDDVLIRAAAASDRQIAVRCAGVQLAEGEENIAARAARLLLEAAGAGAQVTIDIDKRIPVAAGLGGGSSNAATVLLGLNELLELGLTQDDLQELGGRLGADVPFFVFQRPAWATGIGTRLAPLPALPQFACVLVNPGISVSTAEVYQSLQLTKGGELASLPRFSVVTREDLCHALHNDLEAVTLPRYSQLRQIKAELLKAGALGALMSGSGATVFGLFEDLPSAESAARGMQGDHGWWARAVLPLA